MGRGYYSCVILFGFLGLMQYVRGDNERLCLTKEVNCQGKEYFPRFDGACNNLKHPTWGATDTPLPRMLPSEYSDLYGKPRTSQSGQVLPSTRKVSNLLKESRKNISPDISHMHVLFGQLLAHDIVHTPAIKKIDGTKLDCDCGMPHKDCFNIDIPKEDEQYRTSGKKCMEFSRSKPAVGIGGCRFSKRQQLTTMSSFIDLTFLYGKSEKECNELRDPLIPGAMRMQADPAGGHHGVLPNQWQLHGMNISDSMDCPMKVHEPLNSPCFVAGDVRVNENPGLVSIQTIFTRYHNHVARELRSNNPFWTSNTIFNTARRIMTGIMQSITYREYVAPLLGPVWTKRFDLKLLDHGYWEGYDSDYNPSISNEFTTAAFRFGHSQVAEILSRPDVLFRQQKHRDVKSAGTFFSSVPLLERNGGGPGSFMRGFMMDNAEKTDATLVDALRNQLFTEVGKRYGDDLFAINAQRGRDHGLPGYNKYRTLCGMTKATRFSDLSNEIPWNTIQKLQAAYKSVDDIDLYVGGLAENNVPGGQVGPTFACILGYAFRALRKGDRFWHEDGNSEQKFTALQLRAIRDTTFARLLCDTSEDMHYVVQYPMLMNQGNHGNIIPCSNIPKLDISAWMSTTAKNRFEYVYPGGVEWTAWFITNEHSVWRLDEHAFKHRMTMERPHQICNKYLETQTRYVRGDSHLQIRYSCYPGTIGLTDFPHELSDKYYWTQWIYSQTVESNNFGCENLVAIQAKTQFGNKFASETGDVFEHFGPNAGFTCKDKHQLNGKCNNYKVRGLCQRVQKNYGSMDSSFKSLKKENALDPNKMGVPLSVLHTKSAFCELFGICCDNVRSKHVKNVVPSSVLLSAQYMCKEYRQCCDV
ncbi:salivary peroxidase/catechol oxidase-like [Styela clava]